MKVKLFVGVVIVMIGWGAAFASPAFGATNTGSLTAGGAPYSAAFTSDGTVAYIANAISNDVSMIDVATGAVVRTITAGNDPRGIAVSPDNSVVYVANAGSGTVTVIDVQAQWVTRTISIPNESLSGIAFTRDGSRAYVTSSFYAGKVFVIDVATETVTGFITVGAYPTWIEMSPDGASAFVVNSSDLTVSAINVASNTVRGSANVGYYPNYLAVNPAGSEIFVTGDQSLTVLDATTMASIRTIPIVGYTQAVAISNDGTQAFVVARTTQPSADPFGFPTNVVSLVTVDLASGNPVDSDVAGGYPYSVALSPDGNTLYVPNYGANNVGVFDVRVVNSAPMLTADDPPSAVAGVPYSYTFTATGSPAPSFTVSAGSLPSGLSLSADGQLTGTPTVAGTTAFTVSATNGVSPDAEGSSHDLVVAPGELTSIVIPPPPLGASAYTAVAGEPFTVPFDPQDAYGNSIVPSTATLTTDPTSSVTPDDITGSTIAFSGVGQRVVTVTIGSITAQVTVAVTPAVVSSIQISSDRSTVAAGDIATFAVTGADRFGNDLGDLTSQAIFTSDQSADIFIGATGTFASAGARTVTATVGSLSDSMNLDVTAAQPPVAPPPSTPPQGSGAGSPVPPSVASTGADAESTLLSAGGLILLGVALLSSSRGLRRGTRTARYPTLEATSL